MDGSQDLGLQASGIKMIIRSSKAGMIGTSHPMIGTRDRHLKIRMKCHDGQIHRENEKEIRKESQRALNGHPLRCQPLRMVGQKVRERKVQQSQGRTLGAMLNDCLRTTSQDYSSMGFLQNSLSCPTPQLALLKKKCGS